MVVSQSLDGFTYIVGMVFHSNGTLIKIASRKGGHGSGTPWNDTIWNAIVEHDNDGCGLGCLGE